MSLQSELLNDESIEMEAILQVQNQISVKGKKGGEILFIDQ